MADNHQQEGAQSSIRGDYPLPVIEEAFDPANQSLADALRASFRVLKLVMLFVLVFFIFSGVFIVDQTKVAVLSRFGEQIGPPRAPGLHFAWPYPIDQVTLVPTAPKTMEVNAFWLKLSEAERIRDLSELNARSNSLNPATDGALLTGDKAIMHMLCSVQYSITDANKFVRNVGDEQEMLKAVIQNASVAEAARTTADIIWKDPGRLARAIQARAQKILDKLQSGITLENVAADKSHYPLQAKNEFIGVDLAANKKRELINEADKEWINKLNNVAGTAWASLNEQIEELDQIDDEKKRQEIIEEIGRILTEEASGEARGKIRLAQRDSEKIISDTLAEANRFKTLLEEYRRNPELFRRRLRQQLLNELWALAGVSKWILPPGQKQLGLWLNVDPNETREAARQHIRETTLGEQK